jgi:tetratricopeptide (TPR) repeat protein
MYKPYLKLYFLIVLHTAYSLAYAQKTDNEAINTKLTELEQQADKFHQQGNKKEEANCLNQMGYIYWEQNFRTEAAGIFIQSLKLNLELNNLNAVKSIYNNLGFICSELEEYQKALDYFNENLKINRSQKKRQDVASALQNIGQVQYLIRQYNQAASSLEEAAGIALECNDMKLAQSCFLQLADTYEKLGDIQKSRTSYEKSAAILSQLQKQRLQTIESQKTVAE